MSFFGTTFDFNGVSCEEFGLMLYDVGSTKQEATTFATSGSVVEDRLPTRYKPLFYGVTQNDPLTFKLVFGLRPDLIENGAALDRFDFQVIASWLTGQQDYCWLVIEQDDLNGARYRCFISDLQVLDVSTYPCTMSCSVTCDSPYAYLPPMASWNKVANTETISIRNVSSHNGFYKPIIRISPESDTIQIVNLSDKGRTFTLTNIPVATGVITVDNENKVITCDAGINLYPYCNFQFVRLRRGANQIKITGSGEYQFICEYPVNVGG